MLFVARITHTVTGITPYHESSDSMRPSMAAASTSHGYSPAMTLLPRDAWIVGGCDCRWLQNHEMKTSPSRHLAFHRCLGKTAHSGKWSSDASPLSRCDASDALLALFLCAGHCGIVLSHLEAIPIYSNHLWFRYHYACHPLMPVVLVMNCQTALQGLQASQNHNHSRGLKWSCSSAFSPLSSQATGQAFVASALWSSLEHIGPSLFVFSELFKRILMCLGRKFPKPKALTRSIISNAFFQTSC